jgi:hypothetical protein
MADIQFIAGGGKPRLIVVHATATPISDNSTQYQPNIVVATNIGTNYGVKVGMRIHSFRLIDGQPDRKVWGKVTAIDAHRLFVDAWYGGTPTDGQICYRDGWVIDLPACQELTETFIPDQLTHDLYRSRKASLFFGWEYKVELNYAEFIPANTLLELRPALNARPDDTLILIPRIDRPGRQYNVIFDGQIDLARHVQRGHKKVVLKFRGKENVVFPTPSAGYGYRYGTNYGNQL